MSGGSLLEPNIKKNVIADETGNQVLIGTFGELLVGSKLDDIAVQFQYPQLNTEFDIDGDASVVTGDGSISASNSMAIASSATTGTAIIQSKNSIRYVLGHTFYAFHTGKFVGTGTGYLGCTDYTDGFAIKIVNGNMSFGYFDGGVEKGSDGAAGFDDQANFNGSFNVSGLDLTTLNIFVIIGGYLGSANTALFVKKDGWQLLHILKTEGRIAQTHVDNPVFPISIKAINGMTVSTGSWNGGILAGFIPNGRPFHFPNTQIVSGAAAEQGQMTLTGTNVGTMVIFHLKDTFQSIVNKVRAKLLSYDFHIDVPGGTATGTVIFQIVANPTLSGSATYADINSNSSTVEYDHTPGTGASVNATGGLPLVTAHLEYVGSNKGGTVGNAQIEAEKLGAIGRRGDVFAIVVKDKGGNGVTVRANLHWEELF